ncbi:MAG: hypothetical protein ACLQCU_10030 [Acidimicrobiales bacterium]|jgi:hypothetical protein
MLRARSRFLQGYNAQAAVSTDQVVVATEVANEANDLTMCIPMVRAREESLAITDAEGIGTFVADSDYWSVKNVMIDTPAEVFITPSADDQGDRRP